MPHMQELLFLRKVWEEFRSESRGEEEELPEEEAEQLRSRYDVRAILEKSEPEIDLRVARGQSLSSEARGRDAPGAGGAGAARVRRGRRRGDRAAGARLDSAHHLARRSRESNG